jgi:molybdate transport system ATP-binding protein
MLSIREAIIPVGSNKNLSISSFKLQPGECCTIIGNNGSGKTVLAHALNHDITPTDGSYINDFRSEIVSFEKQMQLFETEWQKNNTDMLGPDEDLATTVRAIIQENQQDIDRCQQLAEQFHLTHLLNQPFTALSSGEGRKVLLAQALMNKPSLLILDEPFDGLDVTARAQLIALLAELQHQGMTLVIIVNRFEDIPDFAEKLGWILDCQFAELVDRETFFADPVTQQLMNYATTRDIELPPPLDSDRQPAGLPLIQLNHIHVTFDDRPILRDLTWSVTPGQHWHVAGPNGCGKTTLLNLISGDNPQCYCNDITLFGHKRGSGESIWDIKKQLGIVGPAMHLAYRVSATPLTVLLSGFYDSIGLYQQPGDQEVGLAQAWLALLSMTNMADTAFHQLSYGQQRLLLIARAMLKHPAILILDEPLQGLDGVNRMLVLRYIDRLVSHSQCQLLYVSHYEEDIPACMTHRLQFIPDGNGEYRYEQVEL